MVWYSSVLCCYFNRNDLICFICQHCNLLYVIVTVMTVILVMIAVYSYIRNRDFSWRRNLAIDINISILSIAGFLNDCIIVTCITYQNTISYIIRYCRIFQFNMVFRLVIINPISYICSRIVFTNFYNSQITVIWVSCCMSFIYSVKACVAVLKLEVIIIFKFTDRYICKFIVSYKLMVFWTNICVCQQCTHNRILTVLIYHIDNICVYNTLNVYRYSCSIRNCCLYKTCINTL